MKIIKITMVLLVVCSLLFGSMSCSSDSSAEESSIVTSAVTKGDITNEVTGTGNLAFKTTQDLVFGQTGEASETVNVLGSAVNVVEGDLVSEGDILVEADTKDWQDNVAELEHAVEEAEYSLLQAQASLETAQYNLYAQEDVAEIQDKIDVATYKYNAAEVYYQASLKENSTLDKEYWLSEMTDYEEMIADYEQEIEELLADPEHSGAASSVSELKSLVRSVEKAEYAVTTAQNSVDEAQTELDNELSSNQQIVAPFDGVITAVNVIEGDIVSRTETLIEIADPEAFLADILVSEVDIFSVETGGYAEVTVDAIEDYIFPATIYQIAPLATVSSGVVNYEVVVELTSLVPVDGTEAISLMEGLSVTVNVILEQANDVVLVPTRAITTSGNNSIVQVVNGDAIEERVITIGISDSTNTEVVSGLSEGEEVVVKSSSSSSSSSSNTNMGGGSLMGIMGGR